MSNLNRHKLTLQEKGESGDTLQAIIEFAKKHKPKLIILENVSGAPWAPSEGKTAKKPDTPKVKAGHSIAEMWFAAGYYCHYVRIDTKNYYIPHTRVRGYMACVPMDLARTNPFDPKFPKEKQFKHIEKEEQPFLQSMKKLARDASEPVEAFLLPETDERVVRSKSVDTPSAMRAVNWGTCEAEHTTYRQINRLGRQKPLTNWTLGGSCQPHDSLPPVWIRNSVERIKESVDMQYLRNLRRGFDSVYKK